MKKKLLYKFNVYKDAEVEKRELVKDDSGAEFEKVTKVKEKVPVEISIYKPTKRQRDDAQLEYDTYLNKMLNRGLLTKAMLSKTYKDKGGFFSEEEMKLYNKLRVELFKNQDELIRLGALKGKDKDVQSQWEELVKKQEDLKSDILEIEGQYNTLFEHTAEKRAENHTILWYSLFLTYYKDSEIKEEKEYFDGESFEEKLDNYYEKEENENDPIHSEVRQGIFLTISFWLYSNAQGPEDFKDLEKELNKDKKSETKDDVSV